MMHVRGVIDPFNCNNFYIFGHNDSNDCWYFDHKTDELIEINKIPFNFGCQGYVYGHNCAVFEIKDNYYCLIYGGSNNSATYNIFDFQTQKWNANIAELNNQWFNNSQIMSHADSPFGFMGGCAMIKDIFCKNKIHIMGGYMSEQKYGYFQFSKQMLNHKHPGWNFTKHICFFL